MRYYFPLFIYLFFSFTTIVKAADLNQELTIKSLKEIKQPNNLNPSNIIILELTSKENIAAKTSKNVTFKLLHNNDKTPLSTYMFEAVNSNKINAYVTNASFTDYQHIIPKFQDETNNFHLSFIPSTNEAYRLWVTVKLTSTTHEEYVSAELSKSSSISSTPSDKENLIAEKDEYSFNITFSEPLKVNHLTNGKMAIVNKKHPKLIPSISDANNFLHIIGFYQDQNSMFHLYPLEKKDSLHKIGENLEIDFSWLPEYSGTVKLFAEFKMNDKTIIAPFTIKVN